MNKLKNVERLAAAGVLSRFLAHPVKYVNAMTLLKFIYPFTRKGSLRSAELFWGDTMKVLLPAATDIYLTGGKTHESETRLAKYLIKNLAEGDTFLDIGAHFGYFTLLAAHLVGNIGKVHGIEPAKGTFDVLKDNVSGKGNINVHHNAVSDKEETVSFHEFPVLYSEYNAMNVDKFAQEEWMQKHRPEKTEVQAVTIDGFIRDKKISPAIIKIDVEGAEEQAILGGKETWAGISPIVIMEYLSDEGVDTPYGRAEKILKENGYKSYVITKEGETEQADDILSVMSRMGSTSENIVFKR